MHWHENMDSLYRFHCSIIKFLKICGFNPKNDIKGLKKSIKTDYKKIKVWSENYDTLNLNFEDIITNPVKCSQNIASFIESDIDVSKMASVIIKRSANCSKEMFELSMR